MNGYKILIVDDDPHLTRSVSDYLASLGLSTYVSATGEEGIVQYDRVHPDVTLLDISMPGLSGLDVLDRLRARGATVIMLTGRNEVETAVRAMQLGAENFLVKPMEMQHLAAAVTNAAEKSALRSENAALKRRLRPSVTRRLVRAGVGAVLLISAALVGHLIGAGGGASDSERVPIPIPIDSLSGRDSVHA